MAAVYAAADLVVSRAGAMTVAELAAAGVPAVLVPLPGAPGDHQTANARVLERAGAAVLLPDPECTPAGLATVVEGLLADPGRLDGMGRAARRAWPTPTPRPPARRWSSRGRRPAGSVDPGSEEGSGPPRGGRGPAGPVRGVGDPAVARRIHVVGVGGAGMSAIATVLHAMGHEVSGSDLKESTVTERLRALGVDVAIGHRRRQRRRRRRWSPTRRRWRRTTPRWSRPAGAACPCSTRAETLAAIAARRRCIAVAGTHGKTTTASMLALHPGGGRAAPVVPDRRRRQRDRHQRRVGHRRVDRGGGRRERRHLPPPGPGHRRGDQRGGRPPRPLRHLRRGARRLRRVPGVGPPPGGRRATTRRPGHRRPVGADLVGIGADATHAIAGVRPAAARWPSTCSGPDGDLVVHLSVSVPGLHNARTPRWPRWPPSPPGALRDAAARALARFGGVARRFEFRGERHGVTFVDDYAHLPTEVRAALAAARNGGWARVVAVFQPHRYSRTAEVGADFAGAFDDADVVVVTDVYGAGEAPVPGVSGRLVADAVRRARPDLELHYVPGRSDLVDAVADMLRPGDLCLTLGAGDLTSLPDELMADAGGGPGSGDD